MRTNLDYDARSPAKLRRPKPRPTILDVLSSRTVSSVTTRRPAGGLLRTIVVGLATFSILLVCFSIYQYGQSSPPNEAALLPPRLPSAPSQRLDAETPPGEGVPGVTVGPTTIGPGRNVRLAFYEKEGTRVRYEVAVSSWTPIEGTVDQFLLMDPEIRLRTNAGNAVRVTAKKGILEAARKGSSGLDPQRGRLTGQVLIEFDRLTEEERRQLPESSQGAPDPSELIQVAVEEISFDIVYAKISVPGDLRLWGRDVEFTASELDVRIHEAESRIESLRIVRGGRLELRESAQSLGLNVAGEPRQSQRFTVTEWLRATLTSKLEAFATQRPGASESSSSPPENAEDSNIPVFGSGRNNKSPRTETVQRYFARIEDDVRVSQEPSSDSGSRLEAAALEIYRQWTSQDRTRMTAKSQIVPAAAPSEGNGAAASPVTSGERLTLQWSGRMLIESLSQADARWPGVGSGFITAIGAPVRLVNDEGEATCAKLFYEPDSSAVRLQAADDRPVVVRSTREGVLQAREVQASRSEDAFSAHVTGPGDLVQMDEERGFAAADPAKALHVQFDRQLTLRGRYENATVMDLAGGLRRRRQRVLDAATFEGGVRARQDDTGLTADRLEISLSAGSARRGERSIDRLAAQGAVVMAQGPDRLSAEEVDIPLMTDPQGRLVPVVVTARRDVSAQQGERTLRAAESLVIDFESISGNGVDSGAAHAAAPPAESDSKESSGKPRVQTNLAVHRLRAAGTVSVTDPGQSLDISAQELDCRIRDGENIETAVLRGTAEHPASVQLKSLSVLGPEVQLHVPDDWAEVPRAGRMILQSDRDLDGRQLDRPIPITLTWSDRMKYQGRENRAVFWGSVHAASESGTTVDCERLDVEFDEASALPASAVTATRWWNWGALAEQLLARSETRNQDGVLPGANKQVAALVAAGNVTVQVLESESSGGALQSRVTMHGPKLSVNLREEVSKLTIEGAGDLFLEDFRVEESRPDVSASVGGLFDVQEDAGPFKTLIEWRDLMWYDFSIDQTRFEGDVKLKHFSGRQLAGVFRVAAAESMRLAPGHQTYLSCDVLSADFHGSQGESKVREHRRLGRLGSDRLRQFMARGRVALEAASHNLSIGAESVGFDKDRMLLSAHGSSAKKARILVHKPGEYPQDYSADWFVYDLAKRSVQAPRPVFEGR